MARVTYVKRAQQRYATKPVLDDNGNPVTVPVRDGITPKTTKGGRAIVRRLTVEDRSRPLPNRKCGKCGKEIEVGQPYKWIAPKSGPYGGTKMFRCGDCPTWQVWEYSSSLSARTAEIAHNLSTAIEDLELGEIDEDFDGASALEDVTSALSDAAEEIRALASEKGEAAQNIEDGFQHETSQSQELRDIAEQLESWADDVENTELPDYYAEEHKTTCEACDGSGEVEAEEGEDGATQPCEVCDGSGEVFDQEAAEAAAQEWWDEVISAASGAADECPV